MTPLRQRKTRIIATLGPASDNFDNIEKLFLAGADLFRINFSHGKQEEKAELIKTIRAIEEKHKRPIGIMADLQGPKFRISTFKDGEIDLKEGDHFSFDLIDEPGTQSRVYLPHPEIFSALKEGSHVLLNDGKLKLRVLERSDNSAKCLVLNNGILSDRKGVNLPDALIPLAALTEKDISDVQFAIKHGVDWVALSFVQRPDDIKECRKYVGNKAGIIAKIEKPAALDTIEEITSRADALMVARGDLGVEMPLEDVPVIQRRLIRIARTQGKPVVVATQMLESMITAPVPTRAEVSDVATAVYTGADGVMLSAESAVGDYPSEAVSVMDRIAKQVESDPNAQSTNIDLGLAPNATPEDAITAAARHTAKTVKAGAIVTYTSSGSTALRTSRERPSTPILALTPSTKTARRLTLAWGLNTVRTKDVHSFEEMVAKARRMVLRNKIAKAGDRIVITAGVPFGTPGATNVLHITWLYGNELDDEKGVKFKAE